MPNLPPLSPFTIRPASTSGKPAQRSMLVVRKAPVTGRVSSPKSGLKKPKRLQLKRDLGVLARKSSDGA